MGLRPSIQSALDAFGVDATVTPYGGDPVETRVFWLPSTTVESPSGEAFSRAEARRVLVIPVADVTEVPRLTLITCPEYPGGADQTWRVDQSEKVDYDHHRAIVIPAPEVS